ncbi:MAG: UDP-N-acetylmuramoyl-L-alanine--D-glutamate ligase, partial [Eubacteriales bacterium]|nr:UDP-N-acetylmuramoyl-L-alanine--D-glutamate ligase [Eubacteriales bacterium]
IAKNFGGVEHRIEFVREKDGVKFYNDSIASSPTRARAGLYSFDQKILLIAGGYDKKIPFDDFGFDIVERVKTLYLCGDTADKIESAVKSSQEKTGKSVPIIKCASMEEATLSAAKDAASGDVVMLSPACASFDAFKNFAERGNKFKEIVKSL